MNYVKDFVFELASLFILILYISLLACWDFASSSKASNFGTFLLGFTSSVGITVSGFFYFFRVRKEKRLEKRSNIAEESLIALDHFMFQLADWVSNASNGFIYSRHSKGSNLQYQQATEEQKRGLDRMHDTNPFELHNFCESFKAMLIDFFRAKARASHLENQTLDKQFEELESLLKKFPSLLCSYHQMKDREDDWPRKKSEMEKDLDFINKEGSENIKKISGFIKETLRKTVLYK